MKRPPTGLRVEREAVLTELARGRGHVLRVSYVEGVTGDGKAVSWYSLAEMYEHERVMRPTKKRFTLRRGELEAVAVALYQAAKRAA
jgi:hypothetical protein